MEDGPYFLLCDKDFTPEPFLLTLVSGSDHWFFASSNGSLTAGRRDPDGALFPYAAEDRIHEGQGRTGGTTMLRVDGAVWEPFADPYPDSRRTRTLAKSIRGTSVRYEETRHDLGLTFAQSWTLSDRYGFVRQCVLTNIGGVPVETEVLDGLRDVLPGGADHLGQLRFGALVDGLTCAELDAPSGLGLFRLSALRSDHAEPAESLRATTVWSAGLGAGPRLLCTAQVGAFRAGKTVSAEHRARGRRGAYLVSGAVAVEPGGSCDWVTVADVGADAATVVALREALRDGPGLVAAVRADVARSAARVESFVADADGVQCTADGLETARHFANTTFNVLRGGKPEDGYRIRREPLLAYLAAVSPGVALPGLPETLSRAELIARAADQGPTAERVAREYLPLRHSRRHGDPSRPWNDFTIRRDALGYEGNWRDIFQNWEALAYSFPGYLDGMIGKFLNASTVDGHNPLYLTQDGFDWERIEPGQSPLHLGYWGDHQVVYLLRLLEAATRFRPGTVTELLRRRLFVYADVPYRIRDYAAQVRDARRTIDFDFARDAELARRKAEAGADGTLLADADGVPVRVTLAEKLVLAAAVKLTNYVPGLGIWLNTQRPEWNDGNNALVGYGVSVVTVCHLRRYLAFCRELFDGEPVSLSEPLIALLRDVVAALARPDPACDRDRRALLDLLGEAGSRYRAEVYGQGIGEARVAVSAAELREFCDVALRHLDATIRASLRPDGLYDAYNLMRFTADGVAGRRLYPMLEGQVAVLSAGVLTVAECADVLDALRASPLYRPDQNSYLLYPDRELPGLLAAGVIGPDAPAPLVDRLLAAGAVVRDSAGTMRFAADLRNARDLAALDPAEDAAELYEQVYDHQSYTGRSGTLFKYEGLGCIYWHMVSKLRLAVHELLAGAGAEDSPSVDRIRAHYEEIRDGIGVHKSPAVHGAIPTDPYSHTPGFAGAQQPGMTGQVKEDILARLGELGVTIRAGCLVFRPDLFRAVELLTEPAAFAGIEVPVGAVGLTVCGVPVIVHASGPARVEVTAADGTVVSQAGLVLDARTSADVFNRNGRVTRLDVHLSLRSS